MCVVSAFIAVGNLSVVLSFISQKNRYVVVLQKNILLYKGEILWIMSTPQVRHSESLEHRKSLA